MPSNAENAPIWWRRHDVCAFVALFIPAAVGLSVSNIAEKNIYTYTVIDHFSAYIENDTNNDWSNEGEMNAHLIFCSVIKKTWTPE